ncbi:hypothetical protein GCM10009560_70800 [Nonomuraea longicatena]|uniref:Uncharacterized protein n=2 Tax=Nonomuraea longicatena TaxID=83682 RepID=A0ABN1R278_9ACTN
MTSTERSPRSEGKLARVAEGALRRHRRRPDGTWRDTVYFDILDEEWPGHRARLIGPGGIARPLPRDTV